MPSKRNKQDIYGFKILTNEMKSIKGNCTWIVGKTKSLPKNTTLRRCMRGFHFSRTIADALFFADLACALSYNADSLYFALVKLPAGTLMNRDTNAYTKKYWAKSLQVVAVIKGRKSISREHRSSNKSWNKTLNKIREEILLDMANISLEMFANQQ